MRRMPRYCVTVSLSISGPERVAIVGPNGAGKTTLLRLDQRCDCRHRSGTVRVMTRLAVFDQAVSLLDRQCLHPGQFPRGSIPTRGRERMPRRAGAIHVPGRRSAADRLPASAAASCSAPASPASLGGATPPPLLILDEPTNHLDIESDGSRRGRTARL